MVLNAYMLSIPCMLNTLLFLSVSAKRHLIICPSSLFVAKYSSNDFQVGLVYDSCRIIYLWGVSNLGFLLITQQVRKKHAQNVSKDQHVGETVQLFKGRVWVNKNLQSFDGD